MRALRAVMPHAAGFRTCEIASYGWHPRCSQSLTMRDFNGERSGSFREPKLSKKQVREQVLARATTRFDESSASHALDELEQQLRGTPAEALRITADASVMDACVSFATLAAVYHPRRFTELSPALAHRAQCLYEQLRRALQQHIATIEGASRRQQPRVRLANGTKREL